MIWIVFLYLLSIALGMFFEYCSQRSVWKFRQRFYCLVKQDLFEALLRKRYVDFKKHDLSDYLSFFQNDVDVFRQYLESCITIFQTVLQLFVYAFFLFSLDARLAILIILSSFVSLLVPKLTGKQLSQRKALHLTTIPTPSVTCCPASVWSTTKHGRRFLKDISTASSKPRKQSISLGNIKHSPTL